MITNYNADPARLVFGIYPGSATGDGKGAVTVGPPDDPARIIAALELLQGREHRPFAVRAYRAFTDAPGSGPTTDTTPVGVTRYLGWGRRLDLVLMYQTLSGDLAGYCSFVREMVATYGASVLTLQIGEEPNATDDPTLDGFYPGVADALIAGVSAAKEEARRLGHHHIQVGINTTPLFGEASFFSRLTEVGGQRFVDDLDYVGLDFFPDVFRRIPGGQVEVAAGHLVEQHRHMAMNPAGLTTKPLRITENGWPTGPDRTQERQAEVVRAVITMVASLSVPLNIVGYNHFMLRDANSGKQDLFHQFGLMTDEYQPKPAFHAYRELIDDLSA